MFQYGRLAVTITVAITLSAGCCLTRTGGIPGSCGSCGLGGTGGLGGTACCGAGPALGGADNCCASGCGMASPNLACLPGLRCIKNLLEMSCRGLGCGSGCGEVYWHDWISDPPCPDPCDTCGIWTGVATAVPCSGCADAGPVHQPTFQGAYVGPAFHKPEIRTPSGLTAVSSWGQRLKHGLSPPAGACTDCAPADGGGRFLTGSGARRHLVTPSTPFAPRRPPHPVVADRLR